MVGRPRRGKRWATCLGAWVGAYGPARLAAELHVRPGAVYGWVGGARSPRPEHALRLVELSHGELTFEDVLGQRRARGVRRGDGAA